MKNNAMIERIQHPDKLSRGNKSPSPDNDIAMTKKTIFIVNKPVFGLCIMINNTPYILCLCHHLPERSIKFFGVEKYLCARCFGMFCGSIVGFFLLNICPININISILLLLPLIIDGFLQMLTQYKSNNSRRFVTGFLFGLGLFPFMWGVTNLCLRLCGFGGISNSLIDIYYPLFL